MEEQKQPGLTVREAEVEHNGQVVKLKHYPITRLMKNQALEVASVEFRKRFPDFKDGGFLPTEFEKELVHRIVKWWSLPTHPTAGGWENIEDEELGNKISEKLGIKKILDSMQKVVSAEKEKAKNLSLAGEEVQSTPVS